MSIPQLQWSRRLRKCGEKLRRDGLSKRAAQIMVDLVTKSGSYKEAMIAAGRLKAIASAAKYDGYWTEQVDKGFHAELAELEKLAAVAETRRAGSAGISPPEVFSDPAPSSVEER